MPLHLFKPMLLPLALLIVVNLIAFAWRAIPPADKARNSDSSWQSLQSAAAKPDVRELLLAGHQWGERPVSAAGANSQAPDADTPEATITALNQHIQSQLQGIIRRGDWVLLFANPDSSEKSIESTAAASDNTEEQSASNAKLTGLPLELRSGDPLPDTPWHIGTIWPDRIQLLQSGHDPLIVPLYPLAEPDSEL